MSHHGVLYPEFTFTPVIDGGGTVTTITVACTMYSSPLVQTMESRTVDGQTSDYGVTVTDEDNKVTLGSDSITWSVPTDHQSATEPYVVDEIDGDNILMEDENILIADTPYVIDWKYRALSKEARRAETSDGIRIEVSQKNLIMESTDFKNMMNTLCALQTAYQD